MVHKWTLENQRSWKARLKQLIKNSRQTQVEVARTMAKTVGELEQTNVSENSFVAPLSRFVNAKGSEIDRWFELSESRLAPLSNALGLESTAVLFRLRKEILFGEGEYPVHPLFPTVEWEYEWRIEGEGVSEDSVLIGSCDLTHRLISSQMPGIRVSVQTHYSNVDLPMWSDVCRQLASHLSAVQYERLEWLPTTLWPNMGLQFGEALNVLHTLLYRDECWTEDQLANDWARTIQKDWIDRQVVKPCIQMLQLSEEQGGIVWSSIQTALNQSSLEQLTVSLRDALSPSTETAFDPKWALDLKSSQNSVVTKAIEQIDVWISKVPSEKIIRYLNDHGVLTSVKEKLSLQSPIDACCMGSLVLHSASVDPYYTVWWSALWWAVRAGDWEAIHSVISGLEPWEASSALCFVLSEVEEKYLTIGIDGVHVGSVVWQNKDVEEALSSVLLKQYSGFFELMTLSDSSPLLNRIHRLSERFFDCLPLWSDWNDLVQRMGWRFSAVQSQSLVYWAPYQISIGTMHRWEALQSQVSIPLWKVLEVHAQKGSLQSARLLAQGEDLGRDIWAVVPVRVRLAWLSKVPASRKTLYLFQTMLVDYWQQTDPQIEFVLDIGQAIGFDTVLSWMQGWVNPLFLAQQESGLILGRVSFQFAEHFKRMDLIGTWTRMLWNWLRDKDSVQDGFIHWNSRRVPIAEAKIESLVNSVSELLELGLVLKPQHELLNNAALELDSQWMKTCAPVQYLALSKILLRWKRHQLVNGDEFFLRHWLHQTPLVDLEVERAILDNPELLDKTWRLDTDGARRSEIIRLAGLIRPVPSWAIALANRGVVETGYWPTWLSPHAKEAVGLLPLMIEQAQEVHRLWWLKVYSQHGEVSVDVWKTLQTWLQSPSWRTEQIQTVHFLGPNQTPRMTFGDVLSWILTLHQKVPDQIQSNPARAVIHLLKDIYTTSLHSLSVSDFFALMAILSRNNFHRTLWSIDILTEHWSFMGDDLQATYRANWLANNHQIIDCTHPIVGDWVLEYAILHENPIADAFLIGRMQDGKLDGLSTLLHAEHFESKLMSLLEIFLDSNPEHRQQVHAWVLERPLLLQHRDVNWQRWLRKTLFV